MAENTARRTEKSHNSVENQENAIDNSSEVGKAVFKMIEDDRVKGKADESASLFSIVLKDDSVAGNFDLRGVFNVAVSELEDDSPVRKYLYADRSGRNEVVKAIVKDCLSTDEARKNGGNEQLEKIMYFEALANLSASQGKFDADSNAKRSHALHVLAGQELSQEMRQGMVSDLLSNMSESGDRRLQGEIESARNDKRNEREAVLNAASKKLEELGKGDLTAAVKLLELHLQQAGEGNLQLDASAKASREVLEAAEEFKAATEKPVTLEDAKPTAPRQGRSAEGTLILPGENGQNYKQYSVKAGSIFDAEGKAIGSFKDDGTITLRGMSPFKISANQGTAFHGKGSDGARLDLVSNADLKKFHGFISSTDGQEVFTVTGGNMFDGKGKLVGKFSENGNIETSTESSFSSESLSKFRSGARVVGEENGKSRSFVASTSSTDGFIHIKDEKTGAHVRHEVKMGMLIDSRTGEQTGWVVPPGESADGKLTGGFIVTSENGELKKTAFTEKQDCIFSLQLTGVSGFEAAPMQGITTGKNEIFNIGEAKRLQKQSKVHFSDAKQEIEASERGWGAFNLKRAIGVNEAQKGDLAKKAAVSEKNYDELEKLLQADKSAIAYVDSFKQTRDVAREALYGKPESQKAEDAPPVNAIPDLSSEAVVATVNGKLAIGEKIYTIKNGELYESGRENEQAKGKLLPGYIAQFDNGERLVDLSKEIHVAMQFTSQANAKPAELLGLGPGHFKSGLGYQSGGLVDVNSLTATASRFEQQARKGNEEYFANRPYLTGALGNWMLGDREEMLDSYANQINSKVTRVSTLTRDLMRDAFDPLQGGNRRFDVVEKELATLMYMTGSQAADTQKMAADGSRIQAQVSESAAMAAMTIATAGIGAGFAAAAKGGQLAAIGITSSRVAVAMEMGAGMASGAAIRAGFNASDKSNTFKDALSGSVEGLALQAQAKLLAKMAEAATAAKALKQTKEVARQTLPQTLMSGAKDVLKEAGISTMTSGALMTGQAIRKGESLTDAMDVQALTVASVTNLLGRYASTRAGDFMNSRFVRGALSDVTRRSTADALVRSTADAFVGAASTRAISSVKEQREAAYGEVSLAKTASDVLDAGALGAANGLAMSGLLQTGAYAAKQLVTGYVAAREQMRASAEQGRTVDISAQRMQLLRAANDRSPVAPRQLESLWRGLANAADAANNPSSKKAPEIRTVVSEPEITPEQRRAHELDFQRRFEAGEYNAPKSQTDNKPVSDPVEISKKAINNFLKNLKQNELEGGVPSDNRPVELIKASVYIDDTIGPRQLDTISAPAMAALDDALALVAKTGHGAAEDIANQSISIGPKQIGHVREINSQVSLAKEIQGDIDPSGNFVKVADGRVEAIIAHVRNASKALPETDYFSVMQDVAGRRGMNRWMNQNSQTRALQHEVGQDYQKRLEAAQTDPSMILSLRRSAQEIAASSVAARATEIKLTKELVNLQNAGQSADKCREALVKLQSFQRDLTKARQDASHNATFKAYFAEMDAYMAKAFQD